MANDYTPAIGVQRNSMKICCITFFLLFSTLLTAVIITLGYLYVQMGPYEYVLVRPNFMKSISFSIVAAGCCIFAAMIFAYCTLCGLKKVGVPISLLFLIGGLTIVIVCATLVFFLAKTPESIYEQELITDLHSNYHIEGDWKQKFNDYQLQHNCCGIKGPEDYKNSNFTSTNIGAVPDSCCKQSHGVFVDRNSCLNDKSFPDSSVNRMGCGRRIIKKFRLLSFFSSLFLYAFALLIIIALISLCSQLCIKEPYPIEY